MKIIISYSESEDDNLFYYNSFEDLLKTHDYDDIKKRKLGKWNNAHLLIK